MKTRPHRVLVYLPAYVKSNRDLLRGVLRYASGKGFWDCDVVGISEGYAAAELGVGGEPPDGAVAYMDGSDIAKRLERLAAPVVRVWPDRPSLRRAPGARADVVCASAAVGAAAAAFLTRLAPASFAFAGRVPAAAWSRERRRSFAQALAGAGRAVELIGVGARRSVEAMVRQLALMPHPVALFAENDRLARDVLAACRRRGLDIPGDVLILGVDDDEILCETIHPSISSIRMDSLECGHRAARALASLMAGRRAAGPLTYTFESVAERLSTARGLGAAPAVKRASAVIAEALEREREDGRLRVGDVCRRLGVARRTLEVSFKRETGRTLHDEIMRQRLKRARKLLESDRLTVEAIAEECGFASAGHLGRHFKEEFGQTPAKARRRLEMLDGDRG